jgi:hypothetical protein
LDFSRLSSHEYKKREVGGKPYTGRSRKCKSGRAWKDLADQRRWKKGSATLHLVSVSEKAPRRQGEE